MKKSAYFSLFIITFLLFVLSFPNYSLAHLSSCEASVDPNNISMGSTVDLTFTINNNDQDMGAMRWIKISFPSSNFTSDGNSDPKVFTGFAASPSTPIQETISVVAANTSAGSANWTIEISDSEDGSDPTACSGNLGTSILDPQDLLPPQISNVTLSNVSDSTITISWNTNKDSDATLDYGLDASYGQTKSDSSLGKSHSFKFDSLDANTTYHFRISATDSIGTSQTGDNTFATAQKGLSLTTKTQTVTVTNTKIIGPSPTPTPVPDKTPPYISITTDLSKPFTVSPQVLGSVKDNKAVSKVEYSLDGGKNYFSIDNIKGLGLKNSSFSFTPDYLDDGNYDLVVRAYDSSGNIGYSKKQTLVIDRLPPQVSGVLYSFGPQILNPLQNGVILVPSEQNFKITLSDVGGITAIDIFADDTKTLNSKKFTLTKSSENGLWSGNLKLDKEGEYTIRFSAVDGAGNKTDRNLNKIFVVKKGRVSAPNAKITVYFFNKETNSWRAWDGAAYQEKNPLSTDKNGNYNLFLPSGKYYLQVESYGYQTQTSEFFELKNASPINADFSLKPSKVLVDLKLIKLFWPDFSTLTVSFKNNLPKKTNSLNTLIDKPLPFFTLSNSFRSDSLAGKMSILTFINTWSPTSQEEFSVLNKLSMNKNFNSATIIEGEKASKVEVFKKRGGYSIRMFADEDATQIDAYKLNVLPIHFFVDQKGIIKQIVAGVLSEKEMIEILSN